MIRYRIGDLGAWASGRCPCGRGLPRLEKVAGRVTDFLVGDDGRLVSGIAISVNLVAFRPSLGQVQVRQTRMGAVEYRVKPGPRFDQVADLDYLRARSRGYLGVGTEIEVTLVDDLPCEPSREIPVQLLHGHAGLAVPDNPTRVAFRSGMISVGWPPMPIRSCFLYLCECRGFVVVGTPFP